MPKPAAVQVPDVRDKKWTLAIQILQNVGLSIGTITEKLIAGIEQGIVFSQNPEPKQAADIRLLSSGGEDFGLPTLQASAAGVVPFAVDYSANIELIKGHGELCAQVVQQQYEQLAQFDEENSRVRFWQAIQNGGLL